MCPASLHQAGFKVSNHRCLCKPPPWWQRHINSLNARRQAHFPARSPSRIAVPRFGTSRVDRTLPYPLLISFCRASVPLTCSGLTHSSDAASRSTVSFTIRGSVTTDFQPCPEASSIVCLPTVPSATWSPPTALPAPPAAHGGRDPHPSTLACLCLFRLMTTA